MAQLSERLRQLRKRRSMTQKDLEARSGVPQNTISRIEIGGVQEISTKTLIGLARALQVSTDYLLGLSEDDREITWSLETAAELQAIPSPAILPVDEARRAPRRKPKAKE